MSGVMKGDAFMDMGIMELSASGGLVDPIKLKEQQEILARQEYAKQEIVNQLLPKKEPNWSGITPQQGIGEATLSSSISYAQTRVGGTDAANALSLSASNSQKNLEEEYQNQLAISQNAETLALIYAQDNEDKKTEIKNQAMKEREALEQKHQAAQAASKEAHETAMVAMAQRSAEQQRQAGNLIIASAASDLSNMLMMVVDANDEFGNSQKAAFIAAKALAISSILIQTHVGAANARAIPGVGEGLAALVLAQGYASAGLVAGMAIGEYGNKSKNSKSSGDNYAGAYDKGGYIPTGKHGIVGEYGPEIVNGPAHVTGREATARKLGDRKSVV